MELVLVTLLDVYKMKNTIIIILVLIIPFILKSQNGKLAIIAEGSGVGGLYSFNIDYTLLRLKSDKIRLTIAGGYSNAILKYHRYEYYPIRLNVMIATSTPFFWEIGLNYTFGSFGEWIYAQKKWDSWQSVSYVLPTLGIRYQKQKKGFVFKAYCIPIFNQTKENQNFLFSTSRGPNDGFMNLWYGIGAGYAF